MSDLFADRIPPHNMEAEQAVLGAVFLEPSTVITASEVLIPEDFYRTSHQLIFSVMLDLSEKNEPVDVVTVTNALQSSKRLEEVAASPISPNSPTRHQPLQISSTIVRLWRRRQPCVV
jgi:replicative DNA helicase